MLNSWLRRTARKTLRPTDTCFLLKKAKQAAGSNDLHNYDAPCQGPSNRNNLPVQPCRCRAAERPETSRGRELVFLGGAAGRYSVSEFWLEPRTRGPGVHAHPEDHVFYVIAGTLSLRVNDDWSHVTMSRRLRSRRLFSHRACCETRAKNPSAEARRW